MAFHSKNGVEFYILHSSMLAMADLFHRACRVHRRSAARLLLRACRHAPPACALLRRGHAHGAPTLALCLCLTLSLALALALALA